MQRLQGAPIMKIPSTEKDIKVLKKSILELSDKIYNLTEDVHLKALVNSVFDT